MLVAEAGEDDPAINDSIDRFVGSARQLGAPIELLTNPRARTAPTSISREDTSGSSAVPSRSSVIACSARTGVCRCAKTEAPQAARTCVTRAERRRIVRFRAADGLRLIGVLLIRAEGRGPRHQGGCAPRRPLRLDPVREALRAAGCRVLVFDHLPTAVCRAGADFPVPRSTSTYRRGAACPRARRKQLLGERSSGGAAVVQAASLRVPVQAVYDRRQHVRPYGPRTRSRLRAPDRAEPFVAAEETARALRGGGARAIRGPRRRRTRRLAIFPGAAAGAPQLRERPVRELVDDWIRSFN